MKNNRGFSLIQVMISVATLSAISLGLMKMTETQTKLQRTSLDGQSYIENITYIRNAVNNSNYCSSTFASSSTADTDANLESHPLTINSSFVLNSNTNSYESVTDLAPVSNSTFEFRTAKGRSLYDNSIYQWKVSSVDDLHPASKKHPWVIVGAELKVISSSSTYSDEASAFLAISFMRTTDKDKLSGNTKRKELPIIVNIKENGSSLELRKCYTDTDGAVATACSSMGGVFNQNSTPQCQLSPETVESIVLAGLQQMEKKTVYYDSNNEITTKATSTVTVERFCSNCGSGCNPCKADEVGEYSCTTDSLCGVKRWRNCKAQCGKDVTNSLAGYIYNEGNSSSQKVEELPYNGGGYVDDERTWTVPDNLVGGKIVVHLMGSGSGGGWSGKHKAGGHGHPGSIIVKDIAVTPGMTCDYVIGKGGHGGLNVQDMAGGLGRATSITCGNLETYEASGSSERSCSNCKGSSIDHKGGDTADNVLFDGVTFLGGKGGSKSGATSERRGGRGESGAGGGGAGYSDYDGGDGGHGRIHIHYQAQD